jgi:hypothetical protein
MNQAKCGRCRDAPPTQSVKREASEGACDHSAPIGASSHALDRLSVTPRPSKRQGREARGLGNSADPFVLEDSSDGSEVEIIDDNGVYACATAVHDSVSHLQQTSSKYRANNTQRLTPKLPTQLPHTASSTNSTSEYVTFRRQAKSTAYAKRHASASKDGNDKLTYEVTVDLLNARGHFETLGRVPPLIGTAYYSEVRRVSHAQVPLKALLDFERYLRSSARRVEQARQPLAEGSWAWCNYSTVSVEACRYHKLALIHSFAGRSADSRTSPREPKSLCLGGTITQMRKFRIPLGLYGTTTLGFLASISPRQT